MELFVAVENLAEDDNHYVADWIARQIERAIDAYDPQHPMTSGDSGSKDMLRSRTNRVIETPMKHTVFRVSESTKKSLIALASHEHVSISHWVEAVLERAIENRKK